MDIRQRQHKAMTYLAKVNPGKYRLEYRNGSLVLYKLAMTFHTGGKLWAAVHALSPEPANISKLLRERRYNEAVEYYGQCTTLH